MVALKAACSLCGSKVPRADCRRCGTLQLSLFAEPPPPVPDDAETVTIDELAEASRRADAERRAQVDRLKGLGRPVRIGLVGCSKNKRSAPAPARELYLGPLFRAALGYAALVADETYVVSAFHGLVPLDQVIGPYDRSIEDLKKKERLPWGDRVVESVAARLPGLRPELHILAGSGYHVPLHVAAITRGWTTVSPLAGLPVGRRLQWLKSETAALEAARKRRRPRRSAHDRRA